MLNNIDAVILMGKDQIEQNNFTAFSEYMNRVKDIAKKALFLNGDHIRGLAIKLLELKIEYPIIYRILLIGKFRIDLLEDWKNSGKYKYYIERSSILLEAIVYGIKNKKNSS